MKNGSNMNQSTIIKIMATFMLTFSVSRANSITNENLNIMGLNKIDSQVTWGRATESLNANFNHINSDMEKMKNASFRNKGYFLTEADMKAAYPTANVGDKAYVGTSESFAIWVYETNGWKNSGKTGGDESVDLEQYYTKTEVDEIVLTPAKDAAAYAEVAATQATNAATSASESAQSAADAANSAEASKAASEASAKSALAAEEKSKEAAISAFKAKNSASLAVSTAEQAVEIAKDATNTSNDSLETSISNRYGYNVTIHGLKGGIHTLASAIKDVPAKHRMLGQKITFRTENGDWATYHNESLSLDNYKNVNDWVQEVGISSVQGDINITNAPDYEDLTEAADGTLKFADKEYSAESFSGLGRVYLRKNIVNGVNVLTQDMMSKGSTIYIIQYDYDLQGAEITIPEGCVLDFQGGRIKNGIINGNCTFIDGEKEFFEDIQLNGDFTNNNIYVKWFKLQYENGTYLLNKLLDNLLSLNYPHNVILEAKNYTANLTNTILSDYTALVGEHKTSTIIDAISDDNSYFYLGLKCGSSLRNLTIRVNEGRDIPIIYTDSFLVGENANVQARWEQCINNIFLTNRKYFADGGTLDNIKTTGIRFNVGPYDYKGDLIQFSAYGFSFRGDYDNIEIKSFQKGIVLHVDENVPEGFSKPWCTSIYFSRLNIWAERGVVGSGRPSAYTTLTDYLFQSLKKSSSAEDYVKSSAVYGKFSELVLINMINWDNACRGTVEGTIIDIAPTLRDTVQDTVNGFHKLTPESYLHVSNTSTWAGNLDVNSGATPDAKINYVSSIGGMGRGFRYIYGQERLGGIDTERRVRRYQNEDSTIYIKDELRINNKYVQTREEHENGDYIRKTNGDYKLNAKNIILNDKILPINTLPSNVEPSNYANGTLLTNSYRDGFISTGNGSVSFDIYDTAKSYQLAREAKDYYLGSYSLPKNNTITCDILLRMNNIGERSVRFQLVASDDSIIGGIVNKKDDMYNTTVSPVSFKLKVNYSINESGNYNINIYFVQTSENYNRTWLKSKLICSRLSYFTNTEYPDCTNETSIKVPNTSKYGTFAKKPSESSLVGIGYNYFCTDRKTEEGATNGIMIYYKGNGVWVDALGRVVE